VAEQLRQRRSLDEDLQRNVGPGGQAQEAQEAQEAQGEGEEDQPPAASKGRVHGLTHSVGASDKTLVGMRRRLLIWIGAAVFATVAPAAASAAKVAPAQPVTTLLSTHRVFSSPGGRYQESVSSLRPITQESTTLPVLASRKRGRKTWLLVRLPGRPNSHTGWITASGTRQWVDRWHIVVSTGARRAWIYFSGHVVRNWLVVVGKPSTPTPHGEFFVEENIQEPSSFPGAPYALATSARSGVFTEFDGGPGQVALHGMEGGLEATPGTAVSHGCVRFTDADISWLASRIQPGTPVTITS
jgi:lipoprotein-anchoring transpeptidase ErfK/SrfK